MALYRAFLLQALVLGAAVGSASAGRGILQYGKGKGFGMTAQAVQVATPIPIGPMVAQSAMLAPVNMAPIVTGAIGPGAGVYPYPMTTPVAVGATMINPKQKLASLVAGAAASHGKGIGAAPMPIAGAAMMPGFIGAAPMFAGGIQYQYIPQQVNIPMPAAAVAAPALPVPDLGDVRTPLEALGDAIRDEANKTISSFRGPNYRAAADQARAEADRAMGDVRPHLEAFANKARSMEPKHVQALERIAGAAHNGTNVQMPDVARILDRVGDVASAVRKSLPSLPAHGPRPALAAAQAVQPAVVMTPVPVTSAVPVVSSAVTMPAYIAKPKGKGFGGYLGK